MVTETVIQKTCSKCKVLKDLDQFYNDKKYRYGKGSLCKNCKREDTKQRGRRKLKTEEGKILNQTKTKKYREKEPEKYRWSVTKAQFKKLGVQVDKEQYDQLYKEQDGKCAICKTEPAGKKTKLCIDHCHSSLIVRGLLCDNCNKALGLFKDETERLLNAVNYLSKHDK